MIETLKKQAHDEFNYLLDYIWKSSNLVKYEKNIEQEKNYFIDDPELKKIRDKNEAHKFTKVFPYLIATGNLFSSLSLFEKYIYQLAVYIKQQSGNEIENTKKLDYIKNNLKIDSNKLELNNQVIAAINQWC